MCVYIARSYLRLFDPYVLENYLFRTEDTFLLFVRLTLFCLHKNKKNTTKKVFVNMTEIIRESHFLGKYIYPVE